MHCKLTALLAASAFALAACDSPADDRDTAAPDAMTTGAAAAPVETPAPTAAAMTDAAAGDAPVDEDAALQVAYDEGKAAAARALDDDAE